MRVTNDPSDITRVWTYDQPHLSAPSLVEILQEEQTKEKVKEREREE